MGEDEVTLYVRHVPAGLSQAIDEYAERTAAPHAKPSRTAAIIDLLERGLAATKGGKKS